MDAVRPAPRRRVDRGAATAGARPSRTSCPTAASASCTGRRSCRRTGHWAEAVGRGGAGPPLALRSRPPGARASPSTSRASCTGCAVELADGRTGVPGGAEHGREPAPGFALLRLARGERRGGGRRRATACCRGEPAAGRPGGLPRGGGGDPARRGRRRRRARRSRERARPRRRRRSTPRCCAPSPTHARGAVLLAEGDAAGAPRLVAAGRVRAVARRCGCPTTRRGPGCGSRWPAGRWATEDAAELELDAARATFERLGARTDLRRVARTGHGDGGSAVRSSPSGSARCCAWSRRAAPTGRSRPSW